MIVYSVKNIIDDKIYVGATRRTSLNKRMVEHKSRALANKDIRYTPLYEAIRKYGYESFISIVLERCNTVDELYSAEQKWIKYFKNISPDNCYNLTLGGLGSPGFSPSEESRKKISEALNGRVQSPEFVERRIAPQRGSKRPITSEKLRGRTLSEETKNKIAIANLGRKVTWSDEARKNVAESNRRQAAEGIGAKLHPSIAPQIIYRRNTGETFASIAKSYDVTPSAIFYFYRRNQWVGGCHP